MIGQQQVRALGRLVGERCEGDHELDLREGVAEAEGRRQREDRIQIMDQETLDLARIHLLDEGLHVGQARRPLCVERGIFDRGPDRTDRRVQQQHRRCVAATRRRRRSDSRRQRDGAGRTGELRHELVEERGVDACRSDRRIFVRTARRRRDQRITLGIRDRLGEGQRERALAARPGRHPEVRIRCRQVLARPDCDHAGAAVRLRRDVPALAELARVLEGRAARVEEVRTEVDDEIRARQIEDRNRMGTEELLTRAEQRMIAEGRVAEAPGDTGRGHDLVEQAVERRADGAAEDPGLAGRAAKLRRELAAGVLPADRLQRAVAAAGGRAGDAVGMIGATQARLAAGAQAALVDRMFGIALELDRTAFPGLHVQTAARRALETGRGVFDRDPRRDRLGLDHVRDQLLCGIATACGGGGSRGEAHDFQELTTIELGHALSCL